MGEHDSHHGLGPYSVTDSRPLYKGKPIGEGMCRRLTKRRARKPDGELHCERCGMNALYPGGKLVTLHHRLKRSQLHRIRHWEPANCVWLCGDGVTGCHGWVEANPVAAREEGFHVQPWEEPTEVGVKLWHLDWKCRLDNLGGWMMEPKPDDWPPKVRDDLF